jgi:hypothetical protein
MTNQSDNNHMSSSQGESKPGPFLAKVISHLDSTNMGILEVEILRAGAGNTASEGQLHQVQYMSPFYGVTSEAYTAADPDDYNNTQKSYGMWMIPPDPGSTVVVIFIDGDPKRGYWIGCVMDKGMNFMVPGLAATESVVETQTGRVPVAEYNKKITDNTVDATKVKKPKHPLADVLAAQGLIKDDIRGITTSSARREAPSMVFGISTPGPIDKRPNAKRGPIGKKEHQVPNAFVSRLGGTTFVMDDGDDKFLRKKPASAAGPEYAAIEQGETGGDVTIPHNELFRIRTRTGHQILMHNSEDLIYISNASGTTWIELTSNGKIDIYAEDSISIHTNADFNFKADRDINLEAGRNVNIKAANNIHTESVKNTDIIIGQNGKITTAGKLDINTTSSNKFTSGTTTEFSSGGEYIITASKIHQNGKQATAADIASTLLTHILPTEDGKTFESIMRRVPTHEPYPQHENLDPVKFSTENISRNVDNQLTHPTESMKDAATLWKKYTTSTDTFAKVKGADK